MRSNHSSFGTPHFRVLSDDQIEDIHLATLEVLQRTGVRIFDQEGLDLMKKAGADVCGDRVRVPAHLVEWALQSKPPRVTIYGRDGDPAMYLEDYRVYYGTGPSLPTIVDPFTGERRAVLKQDVANYARLVDALPNIDYTMSMAIVSDCPLGLADREEFHAMVLNTKKPIVGWAYDVDGYADIVEMGIAVRGSLEDLQRRPFFILYAEPTSPLKHSEDAVQKLLYLAERNLPNLYTPGVMLGASGPVTDAGALVVANSELLTGLVLCQLKREGSPFIYGGGVMPLDLRTTVGCYAAPESLLNSAALSDIAHHYRVPMWGFGGVSDSKVFDQQASLEGALASMMAALSGANLIHDVGYIESGLAGSMPSIAVNDEVIGFLKRFMAGMEINAETLSVDLINQVGPGGQYLDTEQTLTHYRENWYPSLLDRHDYFDWEALGKKTLGQRATEKVHQIIKTHQPEPLPRSVQDRLAAIVSRSEQKATVK